MKVIGYRYVSVSESSMDMADFFENKLGIPNDWKDTEEHQGGVFKSGQSALEFWRKRECMPESVMLQLIVDNADEFAQFASSKGVRLDGPMIENGEKIYSLTAPDGMQVTLHSSAE